VADWREVARKEGWTAFTKSVRIPLGGRKHTIQVKELGDELEFYADVPDVDADQLLDLLVSNRSSGLVYWQIDDGDAWAVSRCPRLASRPEMAAYMRETAALADRLELRLSETDR
jgi:hypothetical protein